jgi:hypothetical protein
MKRGITAIAGAVLLGSCAGLGLGSFIQPPTFRSVDGRGSEVRLRGPTASSPLGGATLRIWTRVQNPNAFGLNLAGLAGDLFLDEARAAAVDLPMGLPLAASADTVIPVDIAVDFEDIPRIADVLRNALVGGSIAYRVDGTVGVESQTLGYHEFGPGTVVSGEARVAGF